MISSFRYYIKKEILYFVLTVVLYCLLLIPKNQWLCIDGLKLLTGMLKNLPSCVSERTGVGTLMKDALGKIIANRPEDPIIFLAD